ncbi:MAG: hypothetical protein ACODAQ_02910 [Phycisphaeraceae bacterium]
MQIAAIDNPTASTALQSATRQSAPGFAESLAATLEPGEDEKQINEQEARQAAQQLVSSAFLQPMLKQMRESGFKTEYFGNDPGSDAFNQQLHTELADRIVQRMDLPIVDAVTRFVTQRAGGGDEQSQTGREVDRHG